MLRTSPPGDALARLFADLDEQRAAASCAA
jgi:hypothetical protein